MPALDGTVIRIGENKLTTHHSFNVNGRFHVDNCNVKVRPADHILIVMFALGG